MPLKGSHIVRVSKPGLVLAPMLTLKVLVNLRLSQNVPLSSVVGKSDLEILNRNMREQFDLQDKSQSWGCVMI